MKPVNSVSILGCGWLGFPLAQQLLSLGLVVKGSTTSPEKLPEFEKAGILPFIFNFNGNEALHQSLPDFLAADVLVIAVPPGRTEEKRSAYLQIFSILTDLMPQSAIKQLVFISSTSVYGENNGVVNEETLPQADDPSGLLLIKAEQLATSFGLHVCILRVAGLIGPGRHPARFFSGKKDIPNGLAPVNLIHRSDVVNIILEIIKTNQSGIINACAPSHPSRMDFYTLAARQAGLTPPQFIAAANSWKQVDSIRLPAMDFGFIYPDLNTWLVEYS